MDKRRYIVSACDLPVRNLDIRQRTPSIRSRQAVMATLTFAALDRFSHEIRDAQLRFEGMPSCDGHQFDPCIPHHAVPTNRGGFRVDRNPRNSGGLVRRSVVCERIPTVLPHSAPEIARQSQPAKFRFPDHEMERPDLAATPRRRRKPPLPARRRSPRWGANTGPQGPLQGSAGERDAATAISLGGKDAKDRDGLRTQARYAR